jgi:Profilin
MSLSKPMRKAYTEGRCVLYLQKIISTRLLAIISAAQIGLVLNNLCVTLQGKEGVIIVKTKQTLLITHYPETVQPGQAVTTVEKLGDYLIGTGY